MKKKSILFVSARLPYPMVEGHQIRTFGVLSQLAKKYEIHLISLLREGEIIPTDNKLSKLCSSITGFPITFGFFQNLRALIQSILNSKPLMITRYISSPLRKILTKEIAKIRPDIIHFDLLTLSGLIDVVPANVPIVLNEHNIESDLIKQRYISQAPGLMKLLLKRESKLLEKFEIDSCNKSSLVLACSDNDRDTILKYGKSNVFTIPNGVDTTKLLPGKQITNEHFVFLGGMGWYPNKLGMEWFINEVFPLIYEQNSTIKIDIIGNPQPKLVIPSIYKSNFNVLGFVDNFIPTVQKSRAMIVPLTVGSGTRLKVLEGMALGKCIISTTKGAEGIELIPRFNVVFADTPQSFADALLEFISNEKEAEQIGVRAREIAVSNYDWNVIGEKLIKLYSELV